MQWKRQAGLALLVAAVGGTALYFPRSKPVVTGPDGTTVQEIASCSGELPSDQQEKVDSVRVEQTQLIVQVLANAECGPFSAEAPSARTEGDTVSLGWSWVLPKDAPVAACICTRRLEFRVPNAGTINRPKVVISKGVR